MLDVLAFAAHPDDVELCAGGTMCLLASQGYKTGIVDFTEGQLSSRGTVADRRKEAADAARIMGLAARENLGLLDGDIRDTPEARLAIIQTVRRYRPKIVLINAPECRHPDHGAAARLATAALFQSGLRMIDSADEDGASQEPWRPHHVLHYMQAIPFTPSFVVDVTDVWEQRIAAVQAFRSQFYNPDYEPGEEEADTYVSNKGFFDFIEGQARNYGYRIGATYGEPFLYRHGPVGVTDLMRTLDRERPFR
ncbi:bacillithiol biosynthesis deacetylase BshB1 [soil metagenome]